MRLPGINTAGRRRCCASRDDSGRWRHRAVRLDGSRGTAQTSPERPSARRVSSRRPSTDAARQQEPISKIPRWSRGKFFGHGVDKSDVPGPTGGGVADVRAARRCPNDIREIFIVLSGENMPMIQRRTEILADLHVEMLNEGITETGTVGQRSDVAVGAGPLVHRSRRGHCDRTLLR